MSKNRAQKKQVSQKKDRDIARLEAEIVRLNGELGTQHAECEHMAEAASLAAQVLDMSKQNDDLAQWVMLKWKVNREKSSAHKTKLTDVVLTKDDARRLAVDKTWREIHKRITGRDIQ